MRGPSHPALTLALVAALAAAPARAQDAASDGEGDRSAALFREGRQLLAEGRLREACDRFDQSLELRRSPGTLLNVGSCRAAMGDMVGAIDAFGSAVAMAEREPPSDKAQAQIDAGRRELDRVRARVAHLTLSPPAGETVRVTLDGRPVTRLGVSRPMNPGLHRIEAEADGGQRFELDLTLKEAEVRQITIPSLKQEAASSATPAAAPPSTPSAPAEAPPEPDRPGRPVPTVSWVLFGSGGALLVGGAVTGLLASSRKSELDGQCVREVCPIDHSPLEQARSLATVTDILVGVGAAAVLTGVGIWLFTSPDEPAAELGLACSGAQRCGIELNARF